MPPAPGGGGWPAVLAPRGAGPGPQGVTWGCFPHHRRGRQEEVVKCCFAVVRLLMITSVYLTESSKFSCLNASLNVK